jgi:fluoride exporter
MSLMIICAVLLGGAVGGVLRFWISGIVSVWIGETFPYGTFVVNVVGSFLIGLFSALLSSYPQLELLFPAKELLMIGLCGGLTTFSSFSLQTWNLAVDRRGRTAVANAILSTVACTGAVAGGWWLANAVR